MNSDAGSVHGFDAGVACGGRVDVGYSRVWADRSGRDIWLLYLREYLVKSSRSDGFQFALYTRQGYAELYHGNENFDLGAGMALGSTSGKFDTYGTFGISRILTSGAREDYWSIDVGFSFLIDFKGGSFIISPEGGSSDGESTLGISAGVMFRIGPGFE